MSWKYAHYHQEIVIAAKPELASEAVKATATEMLPTWRLTSTADGFEAKGRCGMHAATATFQIEPMPSGTRVGATLQVERAGVMGYVGWDVFGYYDGQIRHWLEGIRWHVDHPQGSPNREAASEQRQTAVAQVNRRNNALLLGCPLTALLLILVSYLVCAVIGLLTGSLYLPARGNGGSTIHGLWARVISAAILLLAIWIIVRLRRSLRSRTTRMKS